MRPPALGHIAADFIGVFAVPLAFKHMFDPRLGTVDRGGSDVRPRHRVAEDVLDGTGVVADLRGSRRGVRDVGQHPAGDGDRAAADVWRVAHIVTGLTQHSGLAEDVTDHRLNSRTVYMNPISRFVYWNMNYHVEHHMFPMVPFHALPALHAEIKDDLPAPAPSIAAAFGEFVPVLLRQRKDPEYYIHRQLPGTATVAGSTGRRELLCRIGSRRARSTTSTREDVIGFEHDGCPYAIYRSPDDTFFATDGTCTHERADARRRVGDGLHHRMPEAQRSVRLSHREGKDAPIRVDLRTYPTQVDNGTVSIDIG